MLILNFATLVATFVLVGVQGVAIGPTPGDGEIRRPGLEDQLKLNAKKAEELMNRDPPTPKTPTELGRSIDDLYRDSARVLEQMDSDAHKWWITWLWMCEFRAADYNFQTRSFAKRKDIIARCRAEYLEQVKANPNELPPLMADWFPPSREPGMDEPQSKNNMPFSRLSLKSLLGSFWRYMRFTGKTPFAPGRGVPVPAPKPF